MGKIIQCKIPGCEKGVPKVKDTLPFCIKHGGGQICKMPGCSTSVPAAKGGLPFCIRHGGGRRCIIKGCDKSARLRHLCISHGGWKPCKICNNRSRVRGLCRKHLKCYYPNCDNHVSSKGLCCKKHENEYIIARQIMLLREIKVFSKKNTEVCNGLHMYNLRKR